MKKATAVLLLSFVCLVGFSAPEALGQQHCDENNPLSIQFEGFDGILIEPVLLDYLEKVLCAESFGIFIGEKFTILNKYIEVNFNPRTGFVSGYNGYVIQILTPRDEKLMEAFGDTPSKALRNIIDKLLLTLDHGKRWWQFIPLYPD